MDAFVEFFTQWGIFGLFFGSFIAGSVVPLSSEALLVVCLGPLKLGAWPCFIAALAGNVAGGMTCYLMGRLGKMDWIEKYFHVNKEKLDKAQRWVENRGAYMAFFAFLPILGSAITIALGLMRANVWIVLTTMTIGKAIRYALIIWPMLLFF